MPPTADDSSHEFVNTYCVTCHNDKAKTGDVSLQMVDFADVGPHAGLLERVLRKVRSGEMPPAGRPRPDASAIASFTIDLERSLDEFAAAHPNPGRPTVHRLNRAEYSNAVRDLLALDIKPGEWLPIDDSGYGFDNIADVLSTSPALLERYLSAAGKVSRLAVGDLTLKPVVETFEPPRDPVGGLVRRNERISDDLPFGSRGGLLFQHYFPVDATYVFRIAPTRIQADGADPTVNEVRRAVTAGLHTVGVTFQKESTKADGEPADARSIPQIGMDLRLDGRRVEMFDVAQRGAPTEVRLG